MAWERLQDLARALPVVSAPSSEQEQVRTALLLLSAPARRIFPRRTGWVLLSIAAAAVLLFIVPRSKEQITTASTTSTSRAASAQTTDIHRGSVHPIDGALFVLERSQPDEIVRLREGRVDVEVDPLHSGERFRVVVGDAEIEVRGTSFQVVATGDRLRSVDVLRGSVWVRPQSGSPVLLGPGGRWEVRGADQPPFPTAIAKKRALHRTAVDRPSVSASEPPQNRAEIAFADGWAALRSRRFSDAAAAFERASANAGDQPLIEDAWFWMAVCEARIPNKAAAKLSLAGFIYRFPRSARIGEVSVMLGWILLDDTDLQSAARLFAGASHDRVSEVRQSALAGLDAVEHRRERAARARRPGGQ